MPLVDVGTATLRLSHAHTQTEVNVPPHCPMPASTAAVSEQQTDFVVFYNSQMTRDSYTATSPPDCHLATAQMSVGNSPPPPTCEFSAYSQARILHFQDFFSTSFNNLFSISPVGSFQIYQQMFT